jgi:hypothetical protein
LQGRVQEAILHFNVLLQQTDELLRPDTRTMSLMMAAFVDEADPLAAIRAFSDVTSLHVQPDVECINLLLTSLGQLQQWETAWEVLQLAEAGGSTNLVSLRIMAEILQTAHQRAPAAGADAQSRMLSVAEQACSSWSCNLRFASVLHMPWKLYSEVQARLTVHLLSRQVLWQRGDQLDDASASSIHPVRS